MQYRATKSGTWGEVTKGDTVVVPETTFVKDELVDGDLMDKAHLDYFVGRGVLIAPNVKK